MYSRRLCQDAVIRRGRYQYGSLLSSARPGRNGQRPKLESVGAKTDQAAFVRRVMVVLLGGGSGSEYEGAVTNASNLLTYLARSGCNRSTLSKSRGRLCA